MYPIYNAKADEAPHLIRFLFSPTFLILVLLCVNLSLSFSQTEWAKRPEPVLDVGPPGSWDRETVGFHTILTHDGLYHMWYAGNDGTNIRIGYATSVDGLQWTKYLNNPVLDVGDAGAWDGLWVTCPDVIHDGNEFKMWYMGVDNVFTKLVTGYATSPDGISWTKHPGNPVLDTGDQGSWDQALAIVGSVMLEEGLYKMWYTGASILGQGRIGYATSQDGINWSKYDANPVVTIGVSDSWDGVSVNIPDVINVHGTYHMWFRGFNGDVNRIGYASSANGLDWMKSPDPVLDIGSTGSWDSRFLGQPRAILEGETFKMWYGGDDTSAVARIGYATGLVMSVASNSILPADVILLQNYPNPFNPSTILRYKLATHGHMTLKVFDVLGREVARIFDGEHASGEFEITWNADGFSSGVYIVQLQTQQDIRNQKILLVR